MGGPVTPHTLTTALVLSLMMVLPLPGTAEARRREPSTVTHGVATDINTATTNDNTTDADADKKKSAKKKGHLWDYKRKHFNMYSLSQEIAIGDHFIKEQIKAFEKKQWRVDPPEYAATKTRIEKIVKRLAAVSDIPSLPYKVHIFEKSDVVNAICLPGGKIGVFTGLFDKEKGLVDQKSDDEIAAVLAHEIAHATQRHVTRRLTTYNSIGLVGNLLSLGVSRGAGENWGDLVGTIFNTGSLLYFPSYSRKYEKEADQVGFYYLVKAGFDPTAAIRIWERAAERAKAKGKKTETSFFATHPASGERAETLKAYLPDIAAIHDRDKMRKEMREER
jgi:predicted Zn-dependent protease